MYFRSRITKLLLALALIGNVGFASTIRHDGNDGQYTGFANDEFPNVGAMLFTDGTFNAGQPNTYLCSGTLIHQDWVLTAAHCVDGASNIRFGTGNDFDDFSEADWIPAVEGVGIPHPDWNGDLAKGHDIGLFQLSKSISNTITPATLFTGSDERGLVGFSVGYGQTGLGDGTERTTDGQKRVNQNDIDVHWSTRGKDNAYFGMDFDHPTDPSYSSFGLSRPNELEGSTLFGDSGGGTFVLDSGDVYKLAGVNSFISAADGTADGSYGDRSGQTRVALYADWINQTIGGTDGGTDGGGTGGGPGGGNGGGKGKKTSGGEISFFDNDVVTLVQPLAFSTEMTSAVPEPSTLTLAGWIWLVGIALTRRHASPRAHR